MVLLSTTTTPASHGVSSTASHSRLATACATCTSLAIYASTMLPTTNVLTVKCHDSVVIVMCVKCYGTPSPSASKDGDCLHVRYVLRLRLEGRASKATTRSVEANDMRRQGGIRAKDCRLTSSTQGPQHALPSEPPARPLLLSLG